MSEDRLLEVLEEALAARVVEELPRAVGRYQFTHALIQETLQSELSLTRRVRLHARIAEELEKLYGPQAEAHAAELAQSVLGPQKVVQYSLLAGERALATYAWEEALEHFQRGLAAKGVTLGRGDRAADSEAAALLFGLGRAQASTVEGYQIQEPVASIRRAFDFYFEAGDVSRAAAVAGYLRVFGFLVGLTGVEQLLARALELAPAASVDQASLLSTYGKVVGGNASDYAGAQDTFARALAIASRQGDALLEGRVMADAAQVDVFHLRLEAAVDNGLKAAELASGSNNPLTETFARFWAGFALQDMGEFEAARLQAAAMEAPAEKVRDRFWLTSALWSNEVIYRLSGDWATARHFGSRGLEVSPLDPRILASRVLCEFQAGDLEQGSVYLDQLLGVIRQSSPWLTPGYGAAAVTVPLVARITGRMGTLEVARAAVETVLSLDGFTPCVTAWSSATVALIGILQGNIQLLSTQCHSLPLLQGIMLPGGTVSGDHLLGLLSHTMGNLDRASQHFEEALAFCRKAGYNPELAWTCCDYADTLLARGQTGDRQRAMALLDESLAIARELGMRPLMERALSRREILRA